MLIQVTDQWASSSDLGFIWIWLSGNYGIISVEQACIFGSGYYHFKADIVEALEFLKCTYVKDLIYREPAPTSVLKDELEVLEDDEDPDWEDDEEMQAWDTYVIDVDSDWQ